MTETNEGGGKLRQIEILIVGLATVILLPVSCLYARDLAAGIVSPDAEWALAAVLGLLGLWMAVLKGDSFYRQRQAARWTTVVALLVAVVALGYLIWGSSQASEAGVTWLILSAPVVVALHHLVRLIRLRPQEPTV